MTARPWRRSFWLFLFLAGCGALPRIVVLHDPLSAEEHLRLGERYEAEGKVDLALAEYQEALKRSDRPEVLARLGNAYSLAGDLSKAESFYLRALKKNGDDPVVLNNLASLYAAQKKNLDRAEEMIAKALRVDPEHRPYYLETLSEVYLAQGRADAAQSVLTDAERSAPEDPLLQKALRDQSVRVQSACPQGCGPEGVLSEQ
jgi:tetratricopeptide (TPR) repeat protein